MIAGIKAQSHWRKKGNQSKREQLIDARSFALHSFSGGKRDDTTTASCSRTDRLMAQCVCGHGYLLSDWFLFFSVPQCYDESV